METIAPATTSHEKTGTGSAHLPRRTFLRGLGVTLALPALECMTPALATKSTPATPQRMLIIANNLGLLAPNFFPVGQGREYALSPYLATLSDFREDFTVFSGLSHPGVSGAHSTDNCFLTAARGAFSASFRNSISLDQFAASRLPQETRFSTLNLGVNIRKAVRSLSWTRDGVLLPAEDNATRLYGKLFLQGDAKATQRQLQRLDNRGSILDTLLTETRRLRGRISQSDQARLDQYLTSIREVEERLRAARDWELRPKPKPVQPAPEPINDNKRFFEKFDLMLAMAQLAFETDSTRIITLMVDAFRTPVFQLGDQETTTEPYHSLSHHGQNPEKLRQLEAADRQHMVALRKLLSALAQKPEGGQRLLDHTMVLYGSNLGDANIHDTSNLPILLAGGGFQHGQHLAFSSETNTPLCNLYVNMLQQFGVQVDAFASSTGTLTGLNTA